MRRRDRSSLLLLAGLWVSLGFHALIGMGFVRYTGLLGESRHDLRVHPPAPPEPVPPPEPAPRPPEIKLGIAKSAANTMTWLGYERPTEHLAPRSKTEQSAMAVAAPGPSKPAAPGPDARADPTPPVPPRPLIDPAVREQVRQSAQAVVGAIAAARQRLAQLAQELTRKEAPGQPAAKAAPATAEPLKPAAPVVVAANGGGGETPGERVNKESTPVSIKDAPTVHPGQVVAAQGLEIRTIEPHWSTTTLMTRRPRNPTVLITFWRDGRVKEVQWAREGEKIYDTGSTEVNQPLLAALYAWTATGKPLDELDPKDPGACVTIMMTVILVG